MGMLDDLAEGLIRQDDQPAVEPGEGQPVSGDGTFAGTYAGFRNAVERYVSSLTENAAFSLNESDMRFSTAIDVERIRNSTVALIGAGGLGNWQWRVLAGMGFRRIAVFDDDVVSIENIGPQAHNIIDLGRTKAQSVKDAALAYKGVLVEAHECRLSGYNDMYEHLGYVPDIVISCVDNMDFRKAFGEEVFPNSVWSDDSLYNLEDPDPAMYPDLFLDYRMSLGDWQCYAFPVRRMVALIKGSSGISGYERASRHSFFMHYVHKYKEDALFPQSEGLQQPCTERAICYTGANAASYTGAILGWWFSAKSTSMYLYDNVANFMRSRDHTLPFHSDMCFSSQEWTFGGGVHSNEEKKLMERMNLMAAKIDEITEISDTNLHRLWEAKGMDGLLGVTESSIEVVHMEESESGNDLFAGGAEEERMLIGISDGGRPLLFFRESPDRKWHVLDMDGSPHTYPQRSYEVMDSVIGALYKVCSPIPANERPVLAFLHGDAADAAGYRIDCGHKGLIVHNPVTGARESVYWTANKMDMQASVGAIRRSDEPITNIMLAGCTITMSNVAEGMRISTDGSVGTVTDVPAGENKIRVLFDDDGCVYDVMPDMSVEGGKYGELADDFISGGNEDEGSDEQ